MRLSSLRLWMAALLLLGLGLLRAQAQTQGSEAAPGPLVMVGSPLLAAAVNDLAGDALTVDYLVSPEQPLTSASPDLNQLRKLGHASLVLRHEQQAQLDRAVAETLKGGLSHEFVLELCSPTPTAYADFCGRLCKRLSQDFPGLASTFQYNLTRLLNRLQTLEVDLRFRVQGMEGDAVICQEAVKPLLVWLELKPLASFPLQAEEVDEERVKDLVDTYVEEQPTAIVVQGTDSDRLAKALGRALKIKTVQLSRMPLKGQAGSVERWIRDSVEHVAAAVDQAP